jgi:OOP family OmpA-OmpF porin
MSDGTTVEIDAEAPSIDGVLITVTDIEATTGVVHIIDGVMAPEGLDLTDVAPTSPVDVTSADGTVTLTGTVSTEAVRAMLTAAAGGDDVVVVDELVVDPLSGIDTSMAQGLVTLVEVLRTHLLDGSTGFDGEAWYLTGTLLTEADRPAVESAAAELDVVAELASPPDTAQDDASRLQEELDDFVTANPILFEPGSASITEGSQPVLDRIADLIAPVADVAITVEGHTDSDGSAQQNLVLSQLRALAVKRALVERGLPDESIDVEGFGSQQPILDADGVEDKEASRRVVFRVVPLS